MFKKFYNSYLAYVLVYTFYFLSFALFSSLISVYMLGLGFSAGQTSVVVSVAFLLQSWPNRLWEFLITA